MRKLAEFLKPYKKECIAGPAFKLLEAVLELLLPTVMAAIINYGVAARDRRCVLLLGSLMLLMAILGFLCSVTCQYYAARAAQGFGTALRSHLFRKAAGFTGTELERFGKASVVNRITGDAAQLQTAVNMMIRLGVRAPFLCIGATIMAMILDLHLSLVFLAATPTLGFVLYWIIKKTSPLYRKYQHAADRTVSALRENLAGVRVIRAFTKMEYQAQCFEAQSNNLTDTALHVNLISAFGGPLSALVMNIAVIAVLWSGALRIESGSLTQGEIIALVSYITQVLLALIVISNLVVLFTKAYVSAGRVAEILGTQPLPAENAGVQFEIGKNMPAVEYLHVSFRYDGAEEYVLRDICLEIAQGETLGIIGTTGAGKTTLAGMLPRLNDATEGEVRIFGHDVRSYSLSHLRSIIGFAQQDPSFFSGTVAENLRLGDPDAEDGDLCRAAADAQADEFIDAFSEGYAHRLDRGGKNLSGGQRQRLSIARALVHNPRILILDDTMSALDFATEAALRQAVINKKTGRTNIMIAQRAATVRACDRIAVLEEGRIVGLGSHAQLMKTCGVYREICLSQHADGEDTP